MGNFHTAGHESKLNGVSYRKFRSRTRLGGIKLNNDEPIDLAAKKILSQLFIIILVVISVFALMIAKETVTGILTDDSFFSISMTKKYSTPVAVNGLALSPSDSAGYSVVEAVSKWSGGQISASQLLAGNSRDATSTADGLLSELKKQLPGLDFFSKSNIGNYDYLTEIYDSIAQGLPVIVPMAIKESGGGDDGSIYGYGIVTAMDFTTDKITVINSLGTTEVLSTEGFIDSTRFSKFKSMPLTLKLSFTIGVNNKNTAIFIEKQP